MSTEASGMLVKTLVEKPTSTENKTKNGDEQIQGMSLTVSIESPKLADPAILVVGGKPKIRYTREELLKLKDVPLSQAKPEFLYSLEFASLILRNSQSDAPSENGPRGGEPADHRRRIGDPRERIRKENDGIVLSPQRRSFNSGCFVPIREPARTNRSHSPLGKNESSHSNIREIPPGNNRRIGSGRILRDNWDFAEKPDGEGDYPAYRGSGGGPRSGHSGPNDKEEKYTEGGRRSYFDNMGRGGDREKSERRNTNSRYSDRRRVSAESKDEEPEWFSGGPMSQHETIELRGFDEPEKPTKKKHSPSKVKRAQEWANKKRESQDSLEEKDENNRNLLERAASSSSLNQQLSGSKDNDGNENNNNASDDNTKCIGGDGDEKKTNHQQHANQVEEHLFNFDDFLKYDSIPGLTNGVGGDGDNANTKSRFSAWFKRDSPDKQHVLSESRRSSFQEDHILKNLLTEITETSISIPGDSDSYFAPISPAANTTSSNIGGPQVGTKVLNIMEMLQRNKQQQQMVNPLMGDVPQSGMMKRSQLPGKILSLDELEAKMRQSTEQNIKHHQNQKRGEDLTAFNRLLAQVTGGHAVPANGPMHPQNNTMSLLEMLSHSQQQEEAQARMAQATHLLGGPTSPNAMSSGGAPQTASSNAHLTNEMAIKLHQMQAQVQQRQHIEMISKFAAASSMGAGMASGGNNGPAGMGPIGGLGGLGNMGGVHQQMRTSPLQDMGVQQSRELLMRPEAQAILQGLSRGDITPQHIYQQLANPALQPRHREMLHAIIKLQSQKTGGGGAGLSPRVLSPVPPSQVGGALPHHIYAQQQQQQQQQQLRISPHPQNSMHQRIPSPRELQVHTQNILQRALIKKKLEEQQENYRKKQEMQARGTSPSNNNISTSTASAPQPMKSQASPTPLAFTPTSVLRKMTADKDDSGKEGNKSVLEGMKQQPQGRPVTGMKQPAQSAGQMQPGQQQPQQWGGAQYPGVKQPVGRPIVKANSNYQTGLQPDQFFNQQQQRLLNHQVAQQQAQRKPMAQSQPQPSVNSSYHPGAHLPLHMSSFNITHSSSSISSTPSTNQHFSQQLTQQQLRAQHQHRPANTGAPQPTSGAQQAYHPANQQSQQQQQGQNNTGGNTANNSNNGNNGWQQFINTQNSRVNQAGRGGSINDGDLSPTTTNQLARWFSPDLLERARGGELPSTAQLAQRVLSLEEIERQTAPPVHN